jgi:hypothetical protein
MNKTNHSKLRIVGDVHCQYYRYLEIIKDTDYSLQLGDFGFNYDVLQHVDSSKHKILLGNHDNYQTADQFPHFLGNFGISNIGNFVFFYIRGGHSIDKRWRTEGVDWFREEELNHLQAKELISLYLQVKPEIVCSHDCPLSIAEQLYTFNIQKQNNYTESLLQYLFHYHQPKIWYFGHHHINKEIVYKNTLFRCINTLSWIDI